MEENMKVKQRYLTVILLIVVISFLYLSIGCDILNPNKSNENDLGEVTIKLTMKASAFGSIEFDIGAIGKIGVDWGDGIIHRASNDQHLGYAKFSKRFDDHDDDDHEILIYGKVTMFRCHMGEMIDADVSNAKHLKELFITYNNLNTLDVSNNSLLETLSVVGNSLSSLDLSKNRELRVLFAWSNHLTDIDLTHNTKLRDLALGMSSEKNQIPTLDLSKNPLLERVQASEINLTSLNVSNNHSLKWLFIDSNSISSLDLSSCVSLKSLNCRDNQLVDLNISNSEDLVEINVNNNRLSTMDIRGNRKIAFIGLSNNDFSSYELNNLFTSLHENDVYDDNGEKIGKSIYIDRNPGSDKCDTGNATEKGWYVFR